MLSNLPLFWSFAARASGLLSRPSSTVRFPRVIRQSFIDPTLLLLNSTEILLPPSSPPSRRTSYAATENKETFARCRQCSYFKDSTMKNHLMILTQILVRPSAPCTIDCFYYGAQIERLFNWFGKTNFCVRSRAAAVVLSSLRPSVPPLLFLCLPRCDTPRTQCEKQEGPPPPCAAGCFSTFHVTEEYLDDIESTLLSFHPPLLSALSFLVPSHFTANFQPLLEDFTSLPAGCWTSFLRGRAGSGEGASLARLSSFAAG